MPKPPVNIKEALKRTTLQQRVVASVDMRVKTKAKSRSKPSRKKTKEKTPKTPIKTISEAPSSFQFLNYKGLRDYGKIRAFIEWCALSKDDRKPEKQVEFAKLIGVNVDTLSDWKKRTGFFDEVDAIRDQRFRKYITDLDYAMVQAGLRGNPKAAELFYKRYGYLVERSIVEHQPDYDERESEITKRALTNIGLAGLLKELERERINH